MSTPENPEATPKHRLTCQGKPAKAEYRKIHRGDINRDEHRYVMEQQLGRALGRHEVVHHINGDKYDNRPENLQVMSLSEHSRMHQLGANGTKAKLSEEQARTIFSSNAPTSELSAKFGITPWSVRAIQRGKTWPHLAAK